MPACNIYHKLPIDYHHGEIYALNRTRNEQILEQMKEIYATLNKASPPIYLKEQVY